jgi:Asp-tRNA(Asn)/Glu-tRNA(Gln) amidotransferase C subunit
MTMSDNEFENLELYAKIENSLEELQDCLNDINDIIISESKKSSIPEDNVYYIAPNIVKIFSDVQDKPMSIEKIIDLYSEWSENVYIITALNKGKYKNKAVKEHVLNLFKLVKSIEYILADPDKKE